MSQTVFLEIARWASVCASSVGPACRQVYRLCAAFSTDPSAGGRKVLQANARKMKPLAVIAPYSVAPNHPVYSGVRASTNTKLGSRIRAAFPNDFRKDLWNCYRGLLSVCWFAVAEALSTSAIATIVTVAIGRSTFTLKILIQNFGVLPEP
jgi:hypothetical protein